MIDLTNSTLTYVTYVFNLHTGHFVPITKTFPVYHKNKFYSPGFPFNDQLKGEVIKFSVPRGYISHKNRRTKLGPKMTNNMFIKLLSSVPFDKKSVDVIQSSLPDNYHTSGLRLFLYLKPVDFEKVPFIPEEAKLIADAINQSSVTSKVVVVDHLGVPVKFESETVVEQKEFPVESKGSEKSDFFYIEKEVNCVLFLADCLLKETGYSNTLIVGPSGFGKTSIAKEVAKKLNRPFVKVDLSLITEPQEFFGSLSLVNGSTVFTETPFAKAIKEGGYVICLDEINRAYPNIMNPLLALLDDTRCATYNGCTYSVAPNTMFIVTANIGTKFTGTFQADAALMNRMNYIANVGQIPMDVEAKIYSSRTGIDQNTAEAVAKCLSEIRMTFTESVTDFSPRLGISIAYACKYFSILSAFLSCLSHIDITEKRGIVDILKKNKHTDSFDMKLF